MFVIGFSGGFRRFWCAERGFWMVSCGQIVVKTWFLSVTFSPLKIFHFFEIYFSSDLRDGRFDATLPSQLIRPAP
jgi:hypothetical protein